MLTSTAHHLRNGDQQVIAPTADVPAATELSVRRLNAMRVG